MPHINRDHTHILYSTSRVESEEEIGIKFMSTFETDCEFMVLFNPMFRMRLSYFIIV